MNFNRIPLLALLLAFLGIVAAQSACTHSFNLVGTQVPVTGTTTPDETCPDGRRCMIDTNQVANVLGASLHLLPDFKGLCCGTKEQVALTGTLGLNTKVATTVTCP
ncbi:hypothetical protein HK104_010153 [Borealophlyctis nickersoniae]|nr:hypothetical protein HK104_010153 [Borealophlyctis nickersoniae]